MQAFLAFCKGRARFRPVLHVPWLKSVRAALLLIPKSDGGAGDQLPCPTGTGGVVVPPPARRASPSARLAGAVRRPVSHPGSRSGRSTASRAPDAHGNEAGATRECIVTGPCPLLGGGMVNWKSPKMTEPERSTHAMGVDKLRGTHADTNHHLTICL